MILAFGITISISADVLYVKQKHASRKPCAGSAKKCFSLQILFRFCFQVRDLRFEEEVEKRRVLEDALHVLATEHHALECSIGAHEVKERFPKNQRISQSAISEFPLASVSKRG